jgi:hypothetical protein
METEKINKAIFGAADRPLKIGKLELQAYVLEDGTRVLIQSDMLTALGMSTGGGRKQLQSANAQPINKLEQFAQTQSLKPYISTEVLTRTKSPLVFKLPTGKTANGYEATLLPDICNAVLEARENGALNPRQKHIAKQCEILVRGLAVVGIVALVDEATGYQEIRDRDALQKILDKYITGEYAKWTKRFPDEFYQQLFRLKNMTYPPATKNKPSYIGYWTNDIVYSRLAPGVVAKLKELNPRQISGHRARTHHQYMTEDFGTPELKRHLENLIFLMRGSTTWDGFYRMLQRASPKFGDTMQLPFTETEDNDNK